ncbi:MAG: hypothetical protein RL264_713 [Bacteroidota bacterium]
MGISVQILGSGAALPTEKRASTSQYIVTNNRHILIDCGEGTQMQMRKYGVKFQKIKQILISHLHGDHFFGLPGLISTMHLLGRDQNLTIYGHEALEGIIRSMLEIGGQKLDFEINFVTLNYKTPTLLYEDKTIEIHSFPLKHRIPTCGFLIKEKTKPYQLDSDALTGSGISPAYFNLLKDGNNIVLENGKKIDFRKFTLPPKPSVSYAFCSDTAYSEKIISSIENVDLLYHEATFVEEHRDRAKATFHSTAIQAATLAKKANVKKLILGHLSSRYESFSVHESEAKTIFENVAGVNDGDFFEL